MQRRIAEQERAEPDRPSLPSGLPMLVFGGPYSNLRATLAMRAEAARLGIPPACVICTGDVVAYCAEPEETVEAIRDWGCLTIQGNCEEQLAAAAGDCGCGFEEGSACDLLAKGWYPFANARVSAASRGWMASLPKTLRFEVAGLRFLVVHGGVAQMNRFVFASQVDVLAEELALADADVVIAGHAGVPFIARSPIGRAQRAQGESIQVLQPSIPHHLPSGHPLLGGRGEKRRAQSHPSPVAGEGGRRPDEGSAANDKGEDSNRTAVWFNPGVIGMPANDGAAEVWYGLIEQGAAGHLRLSTHRLGYDHVAAAASMRKWGYADSYARALISGLWPSLDVFPEAERLATGKRIEPSSLELSELALKPAAMSADR